MISNWQVDRLNVLHTLQIGLGQVRNDFEELADAILDCDGDGLVAEFLDLLVADLVVALVGVGALALCDFASLDVLLDQLGDLNLFFKT